MLLRQHGRRHQDRHLSSVHDRLEGSPQSHLCLSITHIPAQQPVHRARAFHVNFDIPDGAALVLGLHVRERILQFLLPGGIRGEGMPDRDMPARIQVQQFLRHLLDRLLGFSPLLDPCLPTKPVQGWGACICTHVARQPVCLVDGNKERIPAFVLHRQEFPFVTLQLPLDETREAPDAVVHVHHVVAFLQVRIDRLWCLRRGPGAHPGRWSFPAKDLSVRDQVQVTDLPPFRQATTPGKWDSRSRGPDGTVSTIP